MTQLPRPGDARDDLAAYLSSDELTATLATLLRRWTARSRPAVLVVLDWDVPFADVYPEAELQLTFPATPIIHAGEIEEVGPGVLLVYVIDEAGETAYAIPRP